MKHNTDLSPEQIAALLKAKIVESKLTPSGWSVLNRLSKSDTSKVLNCLIDPSFRMRELLGIERVVVFRVKGSK